VVTAVLADRAAAAGAAMLVPVLLVIDDQKSVASARFWVRAVLLMLVRARTSVAPSGSERAAAVRLAAVDP